jgi:outer membrane protein assembly factor BamB
MVSDALTQEPEPPAVFMKLKPRISGTKSRENPQKCVLPTDHAEHLARREGSRGRGTGHCAAGWADELGTAECGSSQIQITGTQARHNLIHVPPGLLVLLTVLTLARPAGAQTNWPSYRGAHADGIAKGTVTATAWNVEKSENILWKRAIPGLGHSSPIIWGDRLFVTTAINERKTATLKVGLYGNPASAEDNDPQQWKIICLKKGTGEILWDKTAREGVPRQKRHSKATHANCTMATDGASVVAFFGSEGLHCFDMDGRLRWQKDWGTLRINPVVFNDKPDPRGADLEWGFASSPIIHNNRVFVQCDVLTNGFVAALDLADGKEVWRTRRDDTATWSTPNFRGDGPRPQLIVNGWKHMGGYDLRTGEEIWRMSGGGDCPVPTPIVWENLIFLMSSHGPRSPIYAVRTDATGDVSLRDGAVTNRHVAWSVLRGGSYMQTPLVYGDHLYSCHVDGILSCYEARTGKLMYKERLGKGGEGFTASPVASEGKLYFTSEQGSVFVVKPGPALTVLATNQMGEVCMATPAISAGKIYFRTQAQLVAVGSPGS